ncbi:rhodanese-like domain-containing protein [Flagellimonas sp. GZD32]|uniref:rhodanese-like domain-containing protein n=1 Tax=Flagellimonas cixiensis TaxID=3228750 RepID=UPI0035C88EDC
MQQLIKWVLFMAVFANVASCQSQQEKSITKVDKQVIATEVIGKKVQLVDVRTPREYKAGHIEEAVNFDLSNQSNFLKQIETLDKDEPVYVYCLVGSRSAYAANILQDKGFTKVFDYSGGYSDWVRN